MKSEELRKTIALGIERYIKYYKEVLLMDGIKTSYKNYMKNRLIICEKDLSNIYEIEANMLRYYNKYILN